MKNGNPRRHAGKVRRAQAVAALAVLFAALALVAVAAPEDGFTDTAGSVHERDIAALAAAEITKGCNPPANDRYCPEDPVTRAQMASFLVRALSLDPGDDAFVDDADSVHEGDIDALAAAEITKGCNPPANDRYCPEDPVTRAQMASFLVRALDLEPGEDAFVDDAGDVHEADIDALAAAGITRGCNPPENDRYCPDDSVTRAQMASFLVRALDLEPGEDAFVDDAGDVHETDINALAAAGITRGCNPPENDRYCPDEPVTRAQMASFLVRALDLPPAPPSPSDGTSSTTTSTAPSTTTTTVSGPACSTTSEPFGIVSPPFVLDFASGSGGLCDRDGQGVGFPRVDRTSNGTGYVQGNLDVRPASGQLRIVTTGGLANGALNNQDNALSVGLSPPQEPVIIETNIIEPPSGTGNFEQAGVWFGNGEDNFVKLTIQSRSNGLRIEMLEEANGSTDQMQLVAPSGLSSSDVVGLRLVADPVELTVHGQVRRNGGEWIDVSAAPWDVDGELFTADNATLPPGETRTFAGILASHRNGSSPLVYRFDSFSIDVIPVVGTFDFTKVTVAGVPDPTAMAFGPDGKLYVAGVFGKIYRLTLNPTTHQATSVEEFNTLNQFYNQAQRLTLGLTVDPASTASNVILWVSSAEDDGAIVNGGIDVASVVKISGASLQNVQEVISGLPRAKENHSLNALHFGPDGRLYIAAGGTTGGGHTPESCCRGLFGNRWEQPLSAALLVADVKSAGWDPKVEGSCSSGVRNEPNPVKAESGDPDPVQAFPNTIQELGNSWTCGVEVFASGFRNMYDFVFHSNGEMYGADNGLGIVGTFPPETSPDCRYTNNGQSVAFGRVPEHSLDPQPDLFHRIVEGGYYGHPNPSRGECVFKDGSFQGVSPLPNYRPPLYDLGEGRSANGIIEYKDDAFCGALQGGLLVSNFSSGGDITLLRISASGDSVTSVIENPGIVAGLKNPLPLVAGTNGVIFVGEFDQANFPGGGQVTALVPHDGSC